MRARRSAVAAALAITLSAAPSGHAAEASPSCAPKDLAALAGWGGVWAAEGVDAVDRGIGGQFGSSDDYKLAGLSAPWNDQGWSRMGAMLRLANSPSLKLSVWGYPMMMASFAELKFVISFAETAIVNQHREIRSVYTDGRGHMPEDELWSTTWGDSIGCWEGDTLVIETIGVRYDPVLHPFNPPLSEQARFVEHIRLVAPGRLENEITITDPEYLTEPWTVRVTYAPAGVDRLVQDAFDDRHDTDALTIRPSTRQELEPLPLPPNLALTDAQLDAVAGSYVIDGAPIEIRFERRGARLFLVPPGLQGGIPMFARGPLDFLSLGGDEMRFVSDAEGRITGITGDGPRGPMTATRKPD